MAGGRVLRCLEHWGPPCPICIRDWGQDPKLHQQSPWLVWEWPPQEPAGASLVAWGCRCCWPGWEGASRKEERSSDVSTARVAVFKLEAHTCVLRHFLENTYY